MKPCMNLCDVTCVRSTNALYAEGAKFGKSKSFTVMNYIVAETRGMKLTDVASFAVCLKEMHCMEDRPCM